jgi:hypothetical protein
MSGLLNTPPDPAAATAQTPAPPPADPKAGMLSDWYFNYMKTPPKPVTYSAASASASTWNPDANSTVQGQLTKVLDAGGPLMDRATTKAKQGMGERGLLNSSIAIGAGQSALYDAATPIATSDANIFADAGKTNAQLGTQASIANAGFSNDASRFNAGASNDAIAAKNAAGVGSFQQQQQIQSQKDLQVNEIANQKAMQLIQIGSQATLQDKQLAVEQLMQQTGITAQQALQAMDIANQRAMQESDLASRYDLANMDVQSRATLQAIDIQNQRDLQAANAILQTGLQATDNAVKQSMQAYDAAIRQAMQGTDNESKLAIAKLDIDSRRALAEIDNKWRVELQASQSMATSYQSMVDGITRVMVDPNMDTEAKQAAINNLTTLYNNTLSMQSDLTGLDLGTLLQPTELEPVPGVAEQAPAEPNFGDPYYGGNRGNPDNSNNVG